MRVWSLKRTSNNRNQKKGGEKRQEIKGDQKFALINYELKLK